MRAATTTRTTRSNIDSNKNNSCLPFVSEFHSLLPLLPLSSGSCTASTCLLLLPLLCLLSPSVLYFTCCRTKKIQLKRNNIALHHQSSCPVRQWQLLFQLALPVPAPTDSELDCGSSTRSPRQRQLVNATLAINPCRPTTCKAQRKRERARRGAEGQRKRER